MAKRVKILLILGGIVIFALGGLLGWYIRSRSAPAASLATIRANSPDDPFISPLLLAGVSDQEPYPKYQPLANSINSYIKTAEAQGNATDVSVYFRDLNSGRWTGVNENDDYSPASMLKIAVLIACLKQADADPSFLNKELFMNPGSANLDTDEYFPPQNPIVPGQTYTVNQLITSMIVDSDNNAEGLLTYEVGLPAIDKVFQDLQLPIPTSTSSNSDFMSPRLYARFYRILYNSTYLSDQMSNSVLSLLSQTTFTQGLVAGVPATTTVSHKFGERTAVDASGAVAYRELHDCGIIYYPNDPYFLCIMTKGSDFTKLQPIIANISNIVWKDVAKSNGSS